MLKLKSQSDIMSQIMSDGGQGGDPIPVLDELTQLIRLYSPGDPQIQGQPSSNLSPPLLHRLMPSPIAQKTGSYQVSARNLMHLQKVTTALRRQLPSGDKRKVTKSKIVEYALELLLDDYERFGDESILAKKMLQGK